MKNKNNSALEKDGLHYLNNLRKFCFTKWNTLVAVNGQDGEENLGRFFNPNLPQNGKDVNSGRFAWAWFCCWSMDPPHFPLRRRGLHIKDLKSPLHRRGRKVYPALFCGRWVGNVANLSILVYPFANCFHNAI